MLALKPLAAAALAALLLSILVMVLLLALPPEIWTGWQPATCRASRCFCEAANPNSPVQQPVNTVSSLVFLLPGFAILILGYRPRRPLKHFLPAYTAIVGVAALVTGLGSAFYHASLTLAGQIVDNLGMLLLAGFMLVYALARGLHWSARRTFTAYASAELLFTTVQVLMPDARRFLFAVVLLAALLLEVRLLLTRRVDLQPAWLTAGVALFALAFVLWILDQSGIICNPAGLLQGHALWHLLGAAGVGLLYRYYTGE